MLLLLLFFANVVVVVAGVVVVIFDFADVVVVVVVFAFGIRRSANVFARQRARLSGFGGVREQSSGIVSLSLSANSGESVHHFLFITPKRRKMGMNVFFWGKVLDWLKNLWA